jgi:hypothetical protein
MRWAAPNNSYFLSELDEAGAGGAAFALVAAAAAGFASLLEEAGASTEDTDDVPESFFVPDSLLLSFSLGGFGLAWL